MEQVVLVIHLMLALAIIGLVLLQRSEGGGLGIGQSGGMGGFATPGGAANALTKVTAFMAFCFFGTSLVLGILAGKGSNSNSILDELDKPMPKIEKVSDVIDPEAIDVEDAAAAVQEENQEPQEEPAVPLE